MKVLLWSCHSGATALLWNSIVKGMTPMRKEEVSTQAGARVRGAEMCVNGSNASIAWGSGATRAVFDTPSRSAYAIVRYQGDGTSDDPASWLAGEGGHPALGCGARGVAPG